MPFDYEALVGHLNIVGGRTLSTTPPGVLVEVAPKKAARGREMDTFFALVLPSGQKTASAAFYERMAQLAAETYFNSSGSVTSGVRSLYTLLNQQLNDHNSSELHHYEANMLCAVLHNNDLFVARVGSGGGIYYNTDQTEGFPANFDTEGALTGTPLGVQPVPDIKMSRYTVYTGSRLILADANLAEMDMAAMTNAIRAANLGEVLLNFRELTGQQINLVAAEFVPPDMPSHVALQEGHSSARMPTPAPTPPTPEIESAPVSELTGEARIQVQRSASNLLLKTAQGLDTVNAALTSRTKAQPDPDAETADGDTPEDGENTPPAKGWRQGNLPGGVVVLLPVLLVVLVLMMWLGGTGQSEFELCVASADEGASTARSISSADVNGVLAAWNAVLITVDRCNSIRGETDPHMASLAREGQSIIDRLNRVDRREMTPVEAFPNASLSSIVMRGEDLYTLDSRNGQVYRVTLRGDGMSIVPNSRQPISRMRTGAHVDQFVISDIIDIAWAQDGSGLSQANVLVALDRNGVIMEYSPTFLNQAAQRLLGSERWENPIKITIWQGRLYILDPLADTTGQIWRYTPSGGLFSSAPQEYFTGDRRPNINAAVDFGIDANGRIYVLYSDGVITVFNGGQVEPFSYGGMPDTQTLTSAYSMFLNTDPINAGIYITNRSNRSIVATSLAGTFYNSYRSFDEALFDSLSDVVADESKGIVYAISGNSILAFRKDE